MLYLLLVSWQHDLSAQASAEPSPQGSIVLKWLGNAGWEIQIGQAVILIDPFLTRREANLDAEWKTDETSVLNAIKRADYILPDIATRITSLTFRSSRKSSAPK